MPRLSRSRRDVRVFLYFGKISRRSRRDYLKDKHLAQIVYISPRSRGCQNLSENHYGIYLAQICKNRAEISLKLSTSRREWQDLVKIVYKLTKIIPGGNE